MFLIPTSASLAVFGPISGWLSDRYGPRLFLIVGLVASAAGFLWLTRIGSEDSFVQLTPPLLLVGGGMGLFAAPNRAAMMNAVPAQRRGVASGVGTTLVNTGMTVSLGVNLTIIAGILPRSDIIAILTSSSIHGSDVQAAQNFLSSIHDIFFLSAALTLLALVPTLLRGATPPWTASDVEP